MGVYFMEKNAIILAAGKSNRFAPFTYEKPKGLFIVRNEILIERQIEQLQEAGISRIYIVTGYKAEQDPGGRQDNRTGKGNSEYRRTMGLIDAAPGYAD